MFYRTPVNWGLRVSTHELLWIWAERHASTTHDPVKSEDGRRARDTQAGLMSRQIGSGAGADHVTLRTLHRWTPSFGLSFTFYQNCVEFRWWNGDKFVEVCFSNEQTAEFSKHRLNSPPPKLQRSRTNPELRGFIVRSCLNRLLELSSDRLGHSCHEKQGNLEPPSTWNHKCWPNFRFYR